MKPSSDATHLRPRTTSHAPRLWFPTASASIRTNKHIRYLLCMCTRTDSVTSLSHTFRALNREVEAAAEAAAMAATPLYGKIVGRGARQDSWDALRSGALGPKMRPGRQREPGNADECLGKAAPWNHANLISPQKSHVVVHEETTGSQGAFVVGLHFIHRR